MRIRIWWSITENAPRFYKEIAHIGDRTPLIRMLMDYDQYQIDHGIKEKSPMAAGVEYSEVDCQGNDVWMDWNTQEGHAIHMRHLEESAGLTPIAQVDVF